MTTSLSYFSTSETLNKYLHEIANFPILSESEEQELGNKAISGDLEARNNLVKSNLKFVVSIAKKYTESGVELSDLISEGNIGLLYAVEGFDPKEGRFATYASYWIKKSIGDAIKDKSGITHTENPTDRFENYKTKLKQRFSSTGREAEPFAWLNKVLSLDEPVSDEEDGTTMADFLPAKTQNPEDTIVEIGLAEEIRDILSKYPEKERECLINHFGLENRKAMDIDEIAEAYQLPVSKVNTIIRKTLRSLRTNEKAKALRCFCQE